MSAATIISAPPVNVAERLICSVPPSSWDRRGSPRECCWKRDTSPHRTRPEIHEKSYRDERNKNKSMSRLTMTNLENLPLKISQKSAQRLEGRVLLAYSSSRSLPSSIRAIKPFFSPCCAIFTSDCCTLPKIADVPVYCTTNVKFFQLNCQYYSNFLKTIPRRFCPRKKNLPRKML